MSYARLRCDGSSVYVILTDVGLECCGCDIRYKGESPNVFATTDEIIDHLDGHRRIGQTVPEYCYQELRTDQMENDAWIARPTEDEGSVAT